MGIWDETQKTPPAKTPERESSPDVVILSVKEADARSQRRFKRWEKKLQVKI